MYTNATLLMVLMALVLIPYASALKCFGMPPDLKSSPLKNETLIDSSMMCIRRKLNCSEAVATTEPVCKDQAIGKLRDIYEAVSDATYEAMKKAPEKFKDIVGCATDFCNNASIKCYRTHTDGKSAPIRNESAIVGASVCVRHKFNCTENAIASVSSCRNATIGALRDVYEAVTTEQFEEMKTQTAIYLDVTGCSTDYCNYADGTTVSSTAASRASSTSTPKSGAFILQDPAAGWMTVLILFCLNGLGWL